VANLQAQVITSAAAGLNAAGQLNADLIAEDTRLAVAAARQESAPVDEHDWEHHYRSHPMLWSGRPNPPLVAEAADLEPGSALDVGCGEGADAIWLAARGWRVTGVDLATSALDRAAEHAAAAGDGVATRASWQQVDVTRWDPQETAYDLVSSHFLHLHGKERRELFARLARAVAPGGTLLLVGHDNSDLGTGARRPHAPDMFFTADEVASSLDPCDWEVLVAEARPRPAAAHEGDVTTVHDAVLVARRRD
jgi:2-polyprenyl-3-methyl-5-hydroxy-6-metoxy-1,4-benzoquinol methylase